MGKALWTALWLIFCVLPFEVQGRPAQTGYDEELSADDIHRNTLNQRIVKRSVNTSVETGKVDNNIFKPEILGMTFEYESDKKQVEYDRHGSPKLLEKIAVTMRLYGRFDHKTRTYLRFTKFQQCDDEYNEEPIMEIVVDKSGTTGTVDAVMPHAGELNHVFLCLKTEGVAKFVRQDLKHIDGIRFSKPWLVIKIHKAFLPLWFHLTLLGVLLILSGLFSGLNLGLMSLNKTDLKIIKNTGSLAERSYASAIAPVRNHGNFLLCCLLFSNVLVNASLTILVDDLTSGLIAIMMSTLAIVIFGEIIPQAICSRHGLAVGARTICITKFFMIITAPLAWPLSKVLDRILGEEIGSVYNRERLKELLRVTKDYHGLGTEEVGIISGALDMKSKTVKDIMIRIEDAYMIPNDTLLDYETMSELEYHGYSRIPVYHEERKTIVGLLNIKQLTLLDPNDKIPLKTVMEYYHNRVFFVYENATLDFMLKAFRAGSYGHMAFVQHINDEGPGDPFYETVGLLTMEDVLEELIQAEIMDESDIWKPDGRKLIGKRDTKSTSLAVAPKKPKTRTQCDIPAPLARATVQFLSTSVEPFSKSLVSVSILQRLVPNCVHQIKLPRHKTNFQDIYLYETGKASDLFILILEGQVEVTVGKEKLTYQSGAFTTFGKDFLIQSLAAETARNANGVSAVNLENADVKKRPTFVPDYTVKVMTNLRYLELKFSAYKAAVLATNIEKANADPTVVHSKNWQEEIDKIMENLYEEENPTDAIRRSRISREESVRAMNLSFVESDEVVRKMSMAANPEECKNQYYSQLNDQDEDQGIQLNLSSMEKKEEAQGKPTENTKLLFRGDQ